MKRLLDIVRMPVSDYFALWALLLFVGAIAYWGKVVELAILAARAVQ